MDQQEIHSETHEPMEFESNGYQSVLPSAMHPDGHVTQPESEAAESNGAIDELQANAHSETLASPEMKTCTDVRLVSDNEINQNQNSLLDAASAEPNEEGGVNASSELITSGEAIQEQDLLAPLSNILNMEDETLLSSLPEPNPSDEEYQQNNLPLDVDSREDNSNSSFPQPDEVISRLSEENIRIEDNNVEESEVLDFNLEYAEDKVGNEWSAEHTIAMNDQLEAIASFLTDHPETNVNEDNFELANTDDAQNLVTDQVGISPDHEYDSCELEQLSSINAPDQSEREQDLEESTVADSVQHPDQLERSVALDEEPLTDLQGTDVQKLPELHENIGDYDAQEIIKTNISEPDEDNQAGYNTNDLTPVTVELTDSQLEPHQQDYDATEMGELLDQHPDTRFEDTGKINHTFAEEQTQEETQDIINEIDTVEGILSTQFGEQNELTYKESDHSSSRQCTMNEQDGTEDFNKFEVDNMPGDLNIDVREIEDQSKSVAFEEESTTDYANEPSVAEGDASIRPQTNSEATSHEHELASRVFIDMDKITVEEETKGSGAHDAIATANGEGQSITPTDELQLRSINFVNEVENEMRESYTTSDSQVVEAVTDSTLTMEQEICDNEPEQMLDNQRLEDDEIRLSYLKEGPGIGEKVKSQDESIEDTEGHEEQNMSSTLEKDKASGYAIEEQLIETDATLANQKSVESSEQSLELFDSEETPVYREPTLVSREATDDNPTAAELICPENVKPEESMPIVLTSDLRTGENNEMQMMNSSDNTQFQSTVSTNEEVAKESEEKYANLESPVEHTAQEFLHGPEYAATETNEIEEGKPLIRGRATEYEMDISEVAEQISGSLQNQDNLKELIEVEYSEPTVEPIQNVVFENYQRVDNGDVGYTSVDSGQVPLPYHEDTKTAQVLIENNYTTKYQLEPMIQHLQITKENNDTQTAASPDNMAISNVTRDFDCRELNNSENPNLFEAPSIKQDELEDSVYQKSSNVMESSMITTEEGIDKAGLELATNINSQTKQSNKLVEPPVTDTAISSIEKIQLEANASVDLHKPKHEKPRPIHANDVGMKENLKPQTAASYHFKQKTETPKSSLPESTNRSPLMDIRQKSRTLELPSKIHPANGYIGRANKSATLGRSESQKRPRLQPKPALNDDHLFPESVTPSKVDKELSVRSLTKGLPQGTYDVPYIDDDAFLPKHMREKVGNSKENNDSQSEFSSDGIDWYEPTMHSNYGTLDPTHLADTNECAPSPTKAHVTEGKQKFKKPKKERKLIKENNSELKRKKPSLFCGCFGRQSNN